MTGGQVEVAWEFKIARILRRSTSEDARDEHSPLDQSRYDGIPRTLAHLCCMFEWADACPGFVPVHGSNGRFLRRVVGHPTFLR